MGNKLKDFLKSGAFVLLIAVLTFAGCSDNTFLGPDPTETSQLDRVAMQGGDDLAASGDLTVVSIGVVETVKEVDALTGDVVPIHRNNYHHAFVVKPLGLDKNELITVKSNTEYVLDRRAITFEFGPAGLVFNTASKLKVDISELNPYATTAKLYYLDPKIGDWVLQSEKRIEKGGVATFNIYHFSKYAISD